MLDINKKKQPDFLTEFIETKPHATYRNMKGEMRKDLRHYIAYNEQCSSKKCYCAYCEREIVVNSDKANGSHIEHIRPQSSYQDLDLDYDNMIVSCNSKESCGTKKGSIYFDAFIDPVKYKPSDHFTYDVLSGEIIPKKGIKNSETAEYQTLEKLGLNSIRLTDARKRVIVQLSSMMNFMKKDDIRYFLKQFPSLVEFMLK